MATSTTPLISHRAIIAGTTRAYDSAREKFNALAAELEDVWAGLSVLRIDHSAYHQIIGMGENALPFLFEGLKRGEAYWVYALKCITGEQLESPEMRGNPQQVIDGWLDWASAKGMDIGRI